MATLSQPPQTENDMKLMHAVRREWWSIVISFLHGSGCSDEQCKWATEQTVSHAPERFVSIVVDDCADDQLGNVLSHLLSRRLWRCVGSVLKRNISTEQREWVMRETVQHVSDGDFVKYILPHCLNEELERAIRPLVSRGLWRSVGNVLERGINNKSLQRWAVEQASTHASNVYFVDYRVTHCRDEELELVVSDLVSQGLWDSVGKALERGIKTEQYKWAVEQASKHAADDDFIHYILPRCNDDHLLHVMTHLVSRGLWESVCMVLERDFGTEHHRMIVEQASRHASDDDFVHYILPQCHDEELEHVITPLVSQGLWVSFSNVLQRGIGSEQHRQFIEQASRYASDDTFTNYILPQCHDEELEHVVTPLVSGGLWMSVGKVLERGIDNKRKWSIEQASRHASDIAFAQYILPQCHNQELEHVMTHLVSRDLRVSAGKVLERGIDTEQHRRAVEQTSAHTGHDGFEELEHLVSQGLWESVGKVLERDMTSANHRWAVLEAAKHADDASFDRCILRHCCDDDVVAVFPLLVASRKWMSTQHVVCHAACNILHQWMTLEHHKRDDGVLFWKFIHDCHVDGSLALGLTKAVTQETSTFDDQSVLVVTDGYSMYHSCSHASSVLAERIWWQEALCESLMTSLLHTLCYVMCSDDREFTDSTEHTRKCVPGIYNHIFACIEEVRNSSQHSRLDAIKKWTPVFTEIADTHKNDPLFLLHFLQSLNLYHISSEGKNDDDILLVMFAILPLFSQLQSVALRMMLRDKRWDVVSQACLSHVWEHDQRQLFKAAVEQRQWDVVLQWSDHTVHDDQREWAMKEAFKEEEWEVYLLLADHGLMLPEQMHAHYMVAKYADWGTVKQMVERGGDITEVCDLLENWVTGNLRKKPQGDVFIYEKRGEKLIRMRLGFAKEAVLSPMKALERCKWGSVLFNILHEPTEEYFSLVLDKVIEQQKWHILMHLVRLGMNKAERDWLFPEMVRQQQWGVCRKLLEYGVHVQLCVEALPELMEKNQWTLVARVMEYNVDDAVSRQVMQCAFQRRAGALFWHCLTLMKDRQPLTKVTQVKLFYQAISRDIWHAVKPFVEEKDGPGIQRRDMAFLEAIERHLWDVVDYCQIHGADINMKDENGETPLNREARKEEWMAVVEIVFRDGKPNLLDKDAFSVLNRLVLHRQWNTVKFVIKYGGDIHLPARSSDYSRRVHSPLQALIDERQADVIQFSVMWCGNQKKGLNAKGETALHAACDSDTSGVMGDFIMRRVDPLALTPTGQSALVYAVLNTKFPHGMVAECSALGFSSHQPPVTGPQESVIDDIISTVVEIWELQDFMDCDVIRHSKITSPLVCAVLRDLPEVVLMLFESGATSRTELLALGAQLASVTDSNTAEGSKLEEALETGLGEIRGRLCYSRLTKIMEKYPTFLRELGTNPRTLQSSCRLQIAHRFHFSDKRRQEHVTTLPLPERVKNYLEFSDFCHPDYGQHVTLPSGDTQGDDMSSDGSWIEESRPQRSFDPSSDVMSFD